MRHRERGASRRRRARHHRRVGRRCAPLFLFSSSLKTLEVLFSVSNSARMAASSWRSFRPSSDRCQEFGAFVGLGRILGPSKNAQDRPEFVDSAARHRRVNVGDLLADVHPVGHLDDDVDIGNGLTSFSSKHSLVSRP